MYLPASYRLESLLLGVKDPSRPSRFLHALDHRSLFHHRPFRSQASVEYG